MMYVVGMFIHILRAETEYENICVYINMAGAANCEVLADHCKLSTIGVHVDYM